MPSDLDTDLGGSSREAIPGALAPQAAASVDAVLTAAGSSTASFEAVESSSGSYTIRRRLSFRYRPPIARSNSLNLNHDHLEHCVAYWPLLGNGREDLVNRIDEGDSLTYNGGDITTFGLLSDADADYLNIVGGDAKYTADDISIVFNYRRNLGISIGSTINIFGTQVTNDCTFYRSATDFWNFFRGSGTPSGWYVPDTFLLDGRDHCIAIVEDLGKDLTSLYIDGFMIPVVTSHTAGPHSNDIGIGSKINDTGRYSVGWVSNFRIYNEPLESIIARKITANPWAPFQRKRIIIDAFQTKEAILDSSGSSTATFVGGYTADSVLSASGEGTFAAVSDYTYVEPPTPEPDTVTGGWAQYVKFEQENENRKRQAIEKARKAEEERQKELRAQRAKEIAHQDRLLKEQSIREHLKTKEKNDELARLSKLVKKSKIYY